MNNPTVLLSLLLVLFFGCSKNNSTPLPKGQLWLNYPPAAYQLLVSNCPYGFEYSKYAQQEALETACWYNLVYPQMKSKIYLTYKPVNNNLVDLLTDVQKFTFEHTQKATNIEESEFENVEERVFAHIYHVTGDAASNVQFYITDSNRHFLSGSLYFNCEPNYDSLKPAIDYLTKDIEHLVETLKWK